jgi:hypothetical protein
MKIHRIGTNVWREDRYRHNYTVRWYPTTLCQVFHLNQTQMENNVFLLSAYNGGIFG